jgi:hypothetical protein
LPCPYTHRQTSSKARRDSHNELFEINLLDMFTRHSVANHRRETIAFAKRRQGAAERFVLFVVWRNWVKLRREKKCRQTPAVLLGRTDSYLTRRKEAKKSMASGSSKSSPSVFQAVST